MRVLLTLLLCSLALFATLLPIPGSGATQGTPDPGVTPSVPDRTSVAFDVTLGTPADQWPDACSPEAVTDAVQRFIEALNQADGETLTALIPEESGPLGLVQEPNVFMAFGMPLPSGVLVGASDRDQVVEYGTMLHEAGGAIVLASLNMAIQVQPFLSDAGEPVVHVGLGFLGRLETDGAEPVRFSGKGSIECPDPLQVIVWQAAPLPDEASLTGVHGPHSGATAS